MVTTKGHPLWDSLARLTKMLSNPALHTADQVGTVTRTQLTGHQSVIVRLYLLRSDMSDHFSPSMLVF